MNREVDHSFHTLVVQKIVEEIPGTKSFVLGYKDHSLPAPVYLAGQFLTFVFYRSNGEEARRNYSMSSSPSLEEPLTVTVKRIPNGEYSRRLVDSFKIGDELLSAGVGGFFTFPADIETYRRVIFFAAGSGITPIYSLLNTCLHLYPHLSLVLVYSNTSPASTIFYERLVALANQHSDRLRIEFLFSSAPDLRRARLNFNFMDDLLKRGQDHNWRSNLFFTCGPLDYMRMVTIYLQTNGVGATQIKKEIFHIEKPVKQPIPPDKGAHPVSIETRNKKHTIIVQYPATILQAARKKGMQLPYSCESGQCGSCAARCTAGQVWMYNNEVLTDEELAKGLILTCTAFPVGGPVTIQI